MRNTIVTGLSATCVNKNSAEQLVHKALERGGLSNWTVQINRPFTAVQPCASPGFDEINHIVYLVPIPPNPS